MLQSHVGEPTSERQKARASQSVADAFGILVAGGFVRIPTMIYTACKAQYHVEQFEWGGPTWGYAFPL